MPDVTAPTRIVQNHHLDSTNWDGLALREGDVIVSNWAKSGTTWVQQIVCQLVHDGRADAELLNHSLWPEWQSIPGEDARKWAGSMEGRRLFKSHLPADAIPLAACARYIYVARDPRDVAWSLHAHHMNLSDGFYAGVNGSPKLVGPAFPRPDPDIRAYYRTWVEHDGAPYWPYWSHVQNWWDVRDLPNVMLIHFDDLKAGPEAMMRAVADFIGVEVDPGTWPHIVDHCSFAWMKAHAATLVSSTAFDDVGKFVNSGNNGRWREMLTPGEIAMADDAAARNLSEDCRAWLMRGAMA